MGRQCERCGAKLAPFQPRRRQSDGALWCPACDATGDERVGGFVSSKRRQDEVAKMTSTYQFADGPDWASVKDNYDWKHPVWRAREEDVRRHGIRTPIPVDYGQTPPKVIDGHTRLALAERVGLTHVPTEHHDEFDYRWDHADDEPYKWEKDSKLAADEHLRNPHDGTTEWHHGTPKEFHSFGDEPEEEDDNWDGYDPSDNPHWNTHLGQHWTSVREVANKFARGLYQNRGAHDADGRVITAHLGIHNPKHYASEFDMDKEAFNHAWEHNEAHDPDNVHAKLCHDNDCYSLEEHEHGDEVDRAAKAHYGEGDGDRQNWLRTHHESPDIAWNFKNRLEQAGHDGVTYGNEVEEPKGHTCAITFHDHQIHDPRTRNWREAAKEECDICGVDHDKDPRLAESLHQLADTLSKPYTSPDAEPAWKPSDSYGGYISQDHHGRLLTDGKPTEKLYRVVHPKEWEEAQSKGYLQSQSPMSPGYTRASAKPDERWRRQSADPMETPPKGYTLEIDYHPDDKWHASAEGYAATHAKIPLHRVRRIAKLATAETHTIYRGLHLGSPGERFDPNDDASVLGAVKKQPSRMDAALYGRAWTTDRDVAHRFAHDPKHDQPHPTYGLRPLPDADHPDYAVVLEAQVRHTPKGQGIFAHEREVSPPLRPEDIESLTAHLHTISAPTREQRKAPSLWDRSYVRSISVPKEHWSKVGATAALHVRNPAGKNQGNQWYRDRRDPAASPGGKTLCGAEPTDTDLGWSQARHKSNQGYIECPACLAEVQRRLQSQGAMAEDPYEHWRPTERSFGPTFGLDHRLFNGTRIKPDVRSYILNTLGTAWDNAYPTWKSWTMVYFAGSEASEWTSPSLEGNNDFDVLIGINYDKARSLESSLAGMTDDEVDAKMNGEFRTGLDVQTANVWVPVRTDVVSFGSSPLPASSLTTSSSGSSPTTRPERPLRPSLGNTESASPRSVESLNSQGSLDDLPIAFRSGVPLAVPVADPSRLSTERAGGVRRTISDDDTFESPMGSRQSSTTPSLSGRVEGAPSVVDPTSRSAWTMTIGAAQARSRVVGASEGFSALGVTRPSPTSASPIFAPLSRTWTTESPPPAPDGWQYIGPFNGTWYVNPEAYDIRKIHPYAAYNVTLDQWAVPPPHLPDWSWEKFPEGQPLWDMCEAIADYIRAILALPEPFRTEEGTTLWNHLHADRARAFQGGGQGWLDPGNVVEKYLDQHPEHLWERLSDIRFGRGDGSLAKVAVGEGRPTSDHRWAGWWLTRGGDWKSVDTHAGAFRSGEKGILPYLERTGHMQVRVSNDHVAFRIVHPPSEHQRSEITKLVHARKSFAGAVTHPNGEELMYFDSRDGKPIEHVLDEAHRVASSVPRDHQPKEAAGAHETYYHLTDNPKFKLDPDKVPEDNSLTLNRILGKPRKGLYVTKNPERWINGYDYVRPYVAEIHVHPNHVEHGEYGGEGFIPAEHFAHAKVHRLIPLDAHSREEYGEHGWIESHHGTTFDTNEPVPPQHSPAPLHGYHYDGPDVRDMPKSEIDRHKTRWLQYLQHGRGFDKDQVDHLRRTTGAEQGIFWHGTPDVRTTKGAAYGVHVGTREAARQALEARIGRRADGKDWDGTQEYGKTLIVPNANRSGYGMTSPREGHYPKPATYHEPIKTGRGSTRWEHGPAVRWEDREPGKVYNSIGATYSDQSPVPMDARPSLHPVRIVGEMTNTPQTPHSDWKANGYMKAQIKRGTAKRGFYYRNEGEDTGSISAVVPSHDHLQRLHPDEEQKLRAEAARQDPPVAHIPTAMRPWNGKMIHSPIEAAWEAVGAPQHDNPEERHPERYAPNAGFGVHLIPGQTETRRGTDENGVATEYKIHPVPWRDRDQHEVPPGFPDTFHHEGETYTHAIVPGSKRPAPHVWRIMHEHEYQQAKKRGYFQSDERMNLGDEGTVASDRSTGSFYAADGPNRIVRMRHLPEDGWKRDHDDYIKTHKPIPFERADLVSPIIHNTREPRDGDYKNGFKNHFHIEGLEHEAPHLQGKEAAMARFRNRNKIESAMKLLEDSGFEVIAHDSGDSATIAHCPFCGSGQVIGRSDGTCECAYCHSFFTVQVQPEFPAMPQTVDGAPTQMPGMPGAPGGDAAQDGAAADPDAFMPPDGGDVSEGGDPDAFVPPEGDGGDGDDDGDKKKKDNKPPWLKGSKLATADGIEMPVDSYIKRLALRNADDPASVLTQIRIENGRSS